MAFTHTFIGVVLCHILIGFDKNPGQSFRPTHPMASSMPPPSLASRNMIHPQIDRRDAFLTKNMKEYDTNLSSNTKGGGGRAPAPPPTRRCLSPGGGPVRLPSYTDPRVVSHMLRSIGLHAHSTRHQGDIIALISLGQLCHILR